LKTGEVIKSIRESKNLKSNNVYYDILSRPARVQFEKGLSDTSTSRLFLILDNLNVTLEEFYFIYNKMITDADQSFFFQYTKAFYSDNINEMKEISDSLNRKYKDTNKIKFFHYYLLSKLTLTQLENKKIESNYLKPLKDYLMSCEEWTYYEVVLFTNSVDFFSNQEIFLLYKRAKQKLLFFEMIRKNNNELFDIITNILVIQLQQNNLTLGTFFYNELSMYTSKTRKDTYEEIMLIFFLELLKMMENPNHDQKKINKIINIFDFLNITFRKKQCIDLLYVVQSNNK
jgi:Rgg/GadR/MutR family transcriptional activator